MTKQKWSFINKSVHSQVMVYTSNPSTWKVEAGGSWLWGQPGRCRKFQQTLSYESWYQKIIFKKILEMIFIFLLFSFSFFILFYFIGGTGVWTQGLVLTRQALCHLNNTPKPSAIVCFSDRNFYLGWLQTTVFLHQPPVWLRL
jgi:hypothetical protein